MWLPFAVIQKSWLYGLVVVGKLTLKVIGIILKYDGFSIIGVIECVPAWTGIL